MSDRIDLAAARALVSGYAPEEAVSVKAGSVLALIDAVESAQYVDECAGRGDIESHVLGAGSPLRRLRASLAPFGGDATE